MARSWTGNLFFTPLAADIGPGPEGAAGGASSWTGSLLSTPPSLAGVSANFGPGPEAAVEGRAAGRRILNASHRQLWSWPGGHGWGAHSGQLDVEFAFYACRHRLRAWPRGGGGGVRCLGVEFAFLYFTNSTRGQAMLGHWSQHQ